jgi:hypothetical protein
MKTVPDSPQQELILSLIANSCFESDFDRELFRTSFGKTAAGTATLRHDESGYGGDFQGGLQAVFDWLLSVAKEVPQGLAGDAIKFWLYCEVLKRLPDAKLGSKAAELAKKLRAYLEKQVK